ncbi:NUDIX hydrolase domain-like protein [Tirmania nivea]|nr:NUDIX hydrolase domain-like protein [Tirmania nivea]
MQYDSTTGLGTGKLSKRYGKEIVNYYGGSPLNRLSFLRSKSSFLRAALPQGRFLLLNNLNALSASSSHLAFLTYDKVSRLVESVYELMDEEVVENYDSSKKVLPIVLFLGVDEGYVLEDGKDAGVVFEGGYKGRPYFAVDVSEIAGTEWLPRDILEERREWLKQGQQLGIVIREAAILAQARSLLDWNARNQFCSGCGSRTVSVQAGTKRVCPPRDRAEGAWERPQCVTRSGVHNVTFPRTGKVIQMISVTLKRDVSILIPILTNPDASVIMAIISHKGDKLLLGRQSRWPPSFYSTLAGFLEPGESLEDAVRRETWEESGVRVGHVRIHSSQPWPYPANIMIGCIGEALEDGEHIWLGHDMELQDARWFPMGEVKEALGRTKVIAGDKVPKAKVENKNNGEIEVAGLRVPMATTIAHQLMLAAVNDWEAGLGIEAKI